MNKRFFIGLLGLFAGLGCGGGGADDQAVLAPAAKALVYTDPSSTGWRLIKDSSSTATRVVLNLVGPAGLKARGVSFTLQADAKTIAFGKFDGAYLKDEGVFVLAQAPDEPKLLAGGVKGDALMAGAFQKDRNEGAKAVDAPLFQVALELKAGGAASAGSVIPLKVQKAMLLPEDISTPSKLALQPITLELGKLVAQ
ncbi:MAG: hypothetical protein WAS25_03520 [Geothrix sp.]|uniref:hypothetical protein n=1 Tax=Geothrix sp. TaxID=1962974 RepID=UPI003BB04E5F